MKIIFGKINDHFSRDLYWSKTIIEAESENKKTIYLICVSEEYLQDTLKTIKLDDVQVYEWFDQRYKEIENEDKSIFNKEYHFKVFSNTEEGRKNGITFLKNEVISK